MAAPYTCTATSVLRVIGVHRNMYLYGAPTLFVVPYLRAEPPGAQGEPEGQNRQ